MSFKRAEGLPANAVDAVFAHHDKIKEVNAHFPHLDEHGNIVYPVDGWTLGGNSAFKPKRFGITHNQNVVLALGEDEQGQPVKEQGFALWTWYPGDLKGSVESHLAKYDWKKVSDGIWTGTRTN